MIAAKSLPLIFKCAKTLYDISKQVIANKNQCQRLSKRVESIVGALKDCSVEDFNGTQKEKALLNLVETLEETNHFVKKFIDASRLDRFFHNTDHQQEFERLNMQLSHNVADLKLVLDITSLFDRQQDIMDRQADLAEILTKLDEIASAMIKQQQELLNQKKEMKNELKRRFDSLKFHLHRDVLKAQNRETTRAIDEELNVFLQIPGHDLETEELIGQGGFADVYRGTWISQHHRVAIKTIRVAYLSEEAKKDFFDEIAAMSKIRFDHVLNIFGVCIEPNYYALVLEYMSLGSLYNVLRKSEPRLSWVDRWFVAIQMAKSVNYLHSMAILHRDIKSLNFLMEKACEGYLVKISDFGLAKIRQETSRQTADGNRERTGVGTLQWKAPELLKFGKHSKHSDIYSLGIVFWELASGRIPYEELDEATISQGVKEGERLTIPHDTPPEFVSLITEAWSQDPNKRPTARDLIQRLSNASKMIIENTLKPTDSQTPIQTNTTISVMTSRDPTISENISSSNSSNIETCSNHNKELKNLIVQCQSNADVRFNKQQLTDEDLETIIKEVLINKRCRSLSLAHNQITSKGSSILANALSNNATLQELWLSTNHVSDKGVYYLAQALTTNVTVKKLGLASNSITSVGAIHIAEMLKSNNTLITIGLAMNKIDDQGVQCLANVLSQYNASLEVLTLDRNQAVTDLCINSVINMIKRNRSMKELWINDCSLSEKGKRKLDEAIECNKAFKLVTAYEKSS